MELKEAKAIQVLLTKRVAPRDAVEGHAIYLLAQLLVSYFEKGSEEKKEPAANG